MTLQELKTAAENLELHSLQMWKALLLRQIEEDASWQDILWSAYKLSLPDDYIRMRLNISIEDYNNWGCGLQEPTPKQKPRLVQELLRLVNP